MIPKKEAITKGDELYAALSKIFKDAVQGVGVSGPENGSYGIIIYTETSIDTLDPNRKNSPTEYRGAPVRYESIGKVEFEIL